jgi:putative transposase
LTQQARNLLSDLGDRAEQFRYVIRERDAKFTAASDVVLTGADIRIIRAPVQARRANHPRRGPSAAGERHRRTVRRHAPSGVLDHLVITAPCHLAVVLRSISRTTS